MGETEVSSQEIYRSLQIIIQQNNDLKTEISEIKNNLRAQSEKLTLMEEKVDYLEKVNERLETKLYHSEKKLRKNNIVVFGLPENKENRRGSLLELVKTFFTERLGITLNEADINDTYRIGRVTENNQRPVIVELVSTLKKRQIFGSVKLLKGTQFSIADDLLEKDRRERRLLYEHYTAAKSKGYPAKIRTDTVTINGRAYKYKDLAGSTVQRCEPGVRQTAQTKLSASAPGTPEVTETQEVFKFDQQSSKPALSQLKDQGKGKLNRISSVGTRSRSNSKSSQNSDKVSTKAPAGS